MAAGGFRWGGRSWGANDRAAFSKFLQRRGQSLDAWAHQHGDISKSVFGYRPKPRTLAEAAQQQADDLIQPQIDQTKKETAGLITNAKGFSDALAHLLGGEGDATRAGYSAAAAGTGALSKGFSDALVHDTAAEGANVADILKNAGAPDAQVAGALAKTKTSGDVPYALTGYIPGSTLEREGAAFGAAADRLPAEAVGVGQQNVQQLSQKAIEALTAIHAKAPDLANQILRQMQSDQRARQATDLQREYLGLSRRKTDATLTGVDPTTGLPTYKTTHDAQTRADKKAAKQAAAAEKKTAARGKAVGARNKALIQAREQMATDVKGMIHAPSKQERLNWIKTHPGHSITEMPAEVHPSYVQAKQILFNKYKGLLSYSTRSGRPRLKRQLNQAIDEVLAAYGIHPPVKPDPSPTALPPATANRGPGGLGPH